MDEVGITEINTKEDFMKYMEAASGDGRYGYGGSWEKTYAYNEIAQFVNMFGGDYFDWTKAENKEAIQFMKDMVDNNQTPIDQIADKYEQMNPKINDGKYGSFFMWGLGTDYEKAGMLGDDKIHMAMVPDFSGKGERAIFTDSWNYVLNSASKNKEAAIKFLKYMTEEGGMEASYKAFERYPARADIAEKVVPDTDPAKEMYSRYASECNVNGRPMLPQTMEFITDMGTIFQSCMKDEYSAGMAAALPGVIAANTTLPVIGVPVKGSVLDGVDALYSIIQMPPGIPVATVAINGAMNAAILAVQMLALSDTELAAKFADYKTGLKKKIVKANEELKEIKFEYKTN